MPAVQALHRADDVPPETGAYVPAAHAVHAVAPGRPPYVPAAHGAHADAATAPAYAPAAHVVHPVVPLASPLYAPAAQPVHTASAVARAMRYPEVRAAKTDDAAITVLSPQHGSAALEHVPHVPAPAAANANDWHAGVAAHSAAHTSAVAGSCDCERSAPARSKPTASALIAPAGNV